jgi:hypothetical protein
MVDRIGGLTPVYHHLYQRAAFFVPYDERANGRNDFF